MRAPYKCHRCGLVNLMGTTTCQSCGASLTGAIGTQSPTSASSFPQASLPTPSNISQTRPSTSIGAPQSSVQTSGLFGWTTISGRVIQVDPMFLDVPSFFPIRLLLKLGALALLVYALGSFVLVIIAFIIVVAWAVSKVLPQHFLSNLATQVVSFFLTRRLVGPVASVPVRDFRLRDANGVDFHIRMKGDLRAGNVSVGDEVQVSGWERSGILLLRKGFNKRVRAAIRIKLQ